MRSLLDAEKKDQEVQVEIITLENFTQGILEASTDPDAKFKVQPISGAAFLFHQRQLPGRQVNRKSLLNTPEPSSPDGKKS